MLLRIIGVMCKTDKALLRSGRLAATARRAEIQQEKLKRRWARHSGGIRLAAPSARGRGRYSFYADTRRLVDEQVRTVGAAEHNSQFLHVNSDDRCTCTDKPSVWARLATYNICKEHICNTPNFL